MSRFRKHVTASLIAGFVAILPIGGLVLTIGFLESTISGSGLSKMPFYFPGLGLFLVFLLVYFVGLVVNTLVGRLVWSRIDRLLNTVPALGGLYQTVKQILGYGEGKDAVFHQAVLISNEATSSQELGLVTNRVVDRDGTQKLVIFVPGVPNPTSGRLLIMDANSVEQLPMSVNETMKTLVSMGKTDISLRR